MYSLFTLTAFNGVSINDLEEEDCRLLYGRECKPKKSEQLSLK